MECESRLKSTRERKFACIINSKKGDIMKLEKIKIVKITIALALGIALVAMFFKGGKSSATIGIDGGFKQNPARVVVLDYGTLDTFDALGVKAKLAVPKSYMPAYLSKYNADEYENVGGVKEFNLETINSFKPDLIVISARQQDYENKLSEIAPVYFVRTAIAKDQFAETKKNIEFFGKLFGREEAAKKAISELEAAARRVREKASKNPLRTLVMIANDGKLSAFGSGSRFGFVYDALGLPQADANIKVGRHGQLVNFEYIAKVNPDLILVVDRSAAIGSGADNTKIFDNPIVAGTNAAKSGRIVRLDPECWYLSGGGIESMGKMIAEVERAISK